MQADLECCVRSITVKTKTRNKRALRNVTSGLVVIYTRRTIWPVNYRLLGCVARMRMWPVHLSDNVVNTQSASEHCIRHCAVCCCNPSMGNNAAASHLGRPMKPNVNPAARLGPIHDGAAQWHVHITRSTNFVGCVWVCLYADNAANICDQIKVDGDRLQRDVCTQPCAPSCLPMHIYHFSHGVTPQRRRFYCFAVAMTTRTFMTYHRFGWNRTEDIKRTRL